MTRYRTILLAAAAALGAPQANACTADPAGDFIPTYNGARRPSVDLRCIDAVLSGDHFTLTVTADGPVVDDGRNYYVWGINRGAGIRRLNFAGAPPALPDEFNPPFDAIALTYPDGTGGYSLLPPPSFRPLPGPVTTSGNMLSFRLPLALLPSTGFGFRDYQFTVWSDYQPTGELGDPSNAFKADFSPTITPRVPAPAADALLLGGAAGLAALRRRRFAA
ncbi:MAG: hypothetical protein RQ833_08765 [Sphingomonadaceae bacterium]|nr:hypothetical protein [Sphingomonadaceae bacterium]